MPLVLRGFFIQFLLHSLHLLFFIFLIRAKIVVNKKVWQLSPEFFIYPTTEIRIEIHVSEEELYVHDTESLPATKSDYSYT
jgi:hypothetical protein